MNCASYAGFADVCACDHANIVVVSFAMSMGLSAATLPDVLVFFVEKARCWLHPPLIERSGIRYAHEFRVRNRPFFAEYAEVYAF